MIQHRLATTATILLAFALQMTATIHPAGVELRVSVADLLLPFGLVATLIYLLTTAPAVKRISATLSTFTHWRVPWALLATTAALTILVFLNSILVGKATTGTVSQWAIVNKLVGWIALFAFAIAGYLISRAGDQYRAAFLRAFLTFAAAIGVLTYIAHIAQTLGYSTAPYFISNDTRLGGLMTNPTAFAFLYAVAAVFHFTDMRHQEVWGRRYHIAAIALYIVLIYLSGSRSSWLGLGFGVAALAALRALDARAIVIAVVASLPLTGIALSSRDIADAFLPTPEKPRMVYVLDIPLLSRTENGVEFRLDQLQRSLELWRAQPWMGIGLGSYIVDHADRGFDPPQHLHNSALWLLTETGIVGASIFGAFFLVLAYGLWPGAGAPPFYVAVFAVMMVFVGVSIGTEALYQRHLWVLTGMALALPRGAISKTASTPERDHHQPPSRVAAE